MKKAIKTEFKCEFVSDHGDFKEVVFRLTDDVDANSDLCESTGEGNITVFVDSKAPSFNFFKPQNKYQVTFDEV